jgi:hypothetical protein
VHQQNQVTTSKIERPQGSSQVLAVLGRIRNGGKVGEGTLEVVEALAGSDGHEIADGNQAETVTGCGFA